MTWLEGFDKGMCYWFYYQVQPRSPALKSAMQGVTHFGDRSTLMAAMVVGLVVLVLWRRYRTAAFAALAFLGGDILTEELKVLVGRPRPEVLYPPPPGYSFPSGHALMSTTVYVTLALAALPFFRRKRLATAVLAASLVLVFLIGVSRMYLGVHYFSDVVGGWTMGLAWTLTCHWLEKKREAEG